MRKRHKKALLKKFICPSCKGDITKYRLIGLDMKAKCRLLPCNRVLATLSSKNKWLIK